MCFCVADEESKSRLYFENITFYAMRTILSHSLLEIKINKALLHIVWEIIISCPLFLLSCCCDQYQYGVAAAPLTLVTLS